MWCSLVFRSGDDGESGELVGRWLTTHLSSSDSCAGDFDSDDSETVFSEMELRAAGSATIEYVTFESDAVTVSWVQKFQVQGNVATIHANQSCLFGTRETEFPEDRLTLSGDSLRETGKSRYDDGGGTICEQTFELDLKRAR